MKKNETNEDYKMPKITVDKSLNKYQGKVIFKETLIKANETLKNVKPPKTLKKSNKAV